MNFEAISAEGCAAVSGRYGRHVYDEVQLRGADRVLSDAVLTTSRRKFQRLKLHTGHHQAKPVSS